MSDFPVAKAAFSGLEMLRRRPAVIGAWTVFYILVMVATMALMAVTMGPALAELQAIQELGQEADPMASLGATGRMMGGFLMMIPFYLIVTAVGVAAGTRAILSPEKSAFGYLRLGGDELRLIVVSLVIGLVVGAAYMAGAIFVGIVIAIAGAAGGIAADSPGFIAVVVLAFLPVLLLLLWLLVRFSLAPAQTLRTRSISIFGSWRLTKGRSGKLFVTYLLVLLVYLLLYAVALAALAGLAVALKLDPVQAMQTAFQPDASSLSAIFQPLMIGYMIIMGVLAAFMAALVYCPAAYVYRRLTDDQTESTFD